MDQNGEMKPFFFDAVGARSAELGIKYIDKLEKSAKRCYNSVHESRGG